MRCSRTQEEMRVLLEMVMRLPAGPLTASCCVASSLLAVAAETKMASIRPPRPRAPVPTELRKCHTGGCVQGFLSPQECSVESFRNLSSVCDDYIWSCSALSWLLCGIAHGSHFLESGEETPATRIDSEAIDQGRNRVQRQPRPFHRTTAPVKCQDATTEAPVVTTVISAVSGDAITVADDVKTLPTAALGDQTFPATIISVDAVDKLLGRATSGPTAAPDVTKNTTPEEAPKPVRTVVPRVACVGKEDVSESNAVKVSLSTTNCVKTTKRIIEENPAVWCSKDNSDLATLADALNSKHLKEKLGVTKTETPSSSGSSVFVGILVSGLLAAVAITAEEAFPADQENQGNTLASEAPLNPLRKPRRNPASTEKPPRPKSQTNPPHPPTVTPPPRLQTPSCETTTHTHTHTHKHTHTHTHTHTHKLTF
ncbi:hypothetical protein F7725_001323 [Dissostichus mawsoni]|uniref:Uncharacterized protein n=1 Tax=Dissostichus mawsoni TaxID=36200 RepID=A0A7J5ZL28_DISMA|nr:hypothetical protein F7725_001323 [Dissostichus mawsoni]